MKKKRRFGGDDELNITSMMDMMTIILVFLLKSIGSSEVEVRTSDNLKLPYSTNKAPPMLTVSVVVQKDSILVDGKEVANVQSETNPNVPNVRSYFVDGSEKTGLSINKLFDELNDKKEIQVSREIEGFGNVLKFKSVSFQYSNDIETLTDINPNKFLIMKIFFFILFQWNIITKKIIMIKNIKITNDK